jgi:hypothetical protein
MKVLTRPPLIEYLISDEYWPASREIAQPNNMPAGLLKNFRDPILDIYNITKRSRVAPLRIRDGEPLPRIDSRRGMLKLVIDEYQSTAANGYVRPFVRPTIEGGKRLKQDAFIATAQQMLEDPWYRGRGIRHIMRYTDMGWHMTDQVMRRVAYVVPVGGSQGGWFKGVSASSMHGHSESFVPSFTMLRNQEEECFAPAVGDITVHSPEDSPLYALTGNHLRVSILTKVSAAFLHLV